jgi:hypothetical protein
VNRNLPDNCYELQVLRAIRDTIVTWNDEMKELVKEYYEIAPVIVAKINSRKDCSEIWDDLYNNLVMRCVSLYEENNIEEAVQLYIKTVNDLKKEFIDG